MSSDGLLTAPGLTNRAKKEDSDGPGAPLLAGNGAAIESVVAASGTGWREVDARSGVAEGGVPHGPAAVPAGGREGAGPDGSR